MPIRFDWRLELHPVLVHFPIALLSVAFLFDVLGWVRKSQPLQRASLYCLVTGTAGAFLAVLSGFATPEAQEAERRFRQAGGLLGLPGGVPPVRVHERWALILLTLAILWTGARLLVHYGLLRRPAVALGLGVLAVSALLVTGYYGGQITYGRRPGLRGGNPQLQQFFPGAPGPLAPGSSGAASFPFPREREGRGETQ